VDTEMQNIGKIDLRASELAMLENGHSFITVKRHVSERPVRFYGDPGDMLYASADSNDKPQFLLKIVSLFLIANHLIIVLVKQLSK
jgi:hypothetical protein